MQKSPTSLCKKKHFRGVIGGCRCIGARAICNAFTTWILVGLSRVMTCFTTIFEFISEERFLQSAGTFWVCIFHVLAWVKGWSTAIKQIKIFVGYWILSSNYHIRNSRAQNSLLFPCQCHKSSLHHWSMVWSGLLPRIFFLLLTCLPNHWSKVVNFAHGCYGRDSLSVL